MATLNVIKRKGEPILAQRKLVFDYWLALALAGLVVIGVLMVYSTTFDLGLRIQDDAVYYLKRQLVALGIGLIVVVLSMQLDYHAFRIVSVPLMILTIVLLIFVLLFGQSIFGAVRGLYEGSYQPSELAKLATILYIAHWLQSKGERIKLLNYGLIPFSIITGLVCALIVVQPDLSQAVLVAMISFTLFFVAGADWRQFLFVGVAAAAVFILLMITLPHAAERLADFANAIRDPTQAGWHVQQTLIALGRGGVFGVGLGEGTQKFGALPAAHTDGVFAIVGEELGLIGALAVVAMLGLMTWRGFRTAARARDTYGFLLAAGITCWFAYQALINVAVITAIIPFTGMALPFLSYGGSSMLMAVIGAGILLNVSRDAALGRQRRPQRQE